MMTFVGAISLSSKKSNYQSIALVKLKVSGGMKSDSIQVRLRDSIQGIE